MLNPVDKKVLETILAKEVVSLTEGDIVILRSRRTYLNKDQWNKFSSLLPANEGPTIDPEPQDSALTEEIKTIDVPSVPMQEPTAPVAVDTDGLTTGDDEHSKDPDFVK